MRLKRCATSWGRAAWSCRAARDTDTQHVAAVADVGMYFIPSAHGIAHTPDEYTAIEDLTYGTEILAETLLRLADREGC